MGRLTLMGRVAAYGEIRFVPGEERGSGLGAGVMAANGHVLVADVHWEIDASGAGRSEIRWPGAVTLRAGRTVRSTSRFVEVPFPGLRSTSTPPALVNPDYDPVRIRMTGEIVDPGPARLMKETNDGISTPA